MAAHTELYIKYDLGVRDTNRGEPMMWAWGPHESAFE